MRPIPDIVKEHVLKNCDRMPETDQEINDYLDLINHLKKYQEAVALKNSIGIKMMKKLDLKTPDQIKKEGPQFDKQTTAPRNG